MAARQKARQSWPIRTFVRGQDPNAILEGSPSTAERLAIVWQLTVESWALAGRPLPEYGRKDMPIRCYTLGEAPDR